LRLDDGTDVLLGLLYHTPIQGVCHSFGTPYGGAPATGLTDLLYEARKPHGTDPACDLPSPLGLAR